MSEEPIKVECLEDVAPNVRDYRIVVVPWVLMPGRDFFRWDKETSHHFSDLGTRVKIAHADYAEKSVVYLEKLGVDPAYLLSVVCPPPDGARARVFQRRFGRRFLELLRLTGSAATDLSGFPPSYYGQGRPR